MSYRKPMSFWTFNFLGLSTYDSIMIFTPNILVDYHDGLLSLGPLRPWGGWGHNFKNVCTLQHFWFYLDFLPKIWGSIQVGLLSVSPAGGRAQFLKCMYNSTFLILSLFLCQTFWGVIKLDCYLWALLSPEGGRAQFLKCVYNSKFLILSWFLCQTFEGVIKFLLGHWILLGHWLIGSQ